jgi:hypothetical protein
VLLPCIYVLQPKLVHLYQSSSLLPSPLPMLASASLRLLYSLLFSKHINHIQVFGFLSLPYPYHTRPPLSVTCVQYHNCICFRSIIGIWGKTWFLAFWVWLTSLKMMSSSSIHLPVNDKISFLCVAQYNSILYKCHIFLIHLPLLGHLGYFHSLAIVNSAAINMGV